MPMARARLRPMSRPVYSATLLVLSPRNLPTLAMMWPAGLTMTAPAPAGPGLPRAAPSVKSFTQGGRSTAFAAAVTRSCSTSAARRRRRSSRSTFDSFMAESSSSADARAARSTSLPLRTLRPPGLARAAAAASASRRSASSTRSAAAVMSLPSAFRSWPA